MSLISGEMNFFLNFPDFRGYTIRKKRWTPEQEAKVKLILNVAKNRVEAQKMMQKEGFTADEAARFAHRYYRTFKARPDSRNSNSPRKRSPFGSPNKKALKDQQQELINFSQNVHLRNQDIHKNLRKNKSGIPLSMIGKLPVDYIRPPGFVLVPGLLGSMPGGDLLQNRGNKGSKHESSPEDSK